MSKSSNASSRERQFEPLKRPETRRRNARKATRSRQNGNGKTYGTANSHNQTTAEKVQTVIVTATIAAAIAYAVWRINDTLRHAGDPCRGCKMAEGCKKKRCVARRP